MTELPKQYAIIRASGRQLRVSPGQTVELNRIPDAGKTVTFSDVLLVRNGDTITVGRPKVPNASVTGEVVFSGKAKKVIVQKFKSKTRYRVKRGHRQDIVRVKITGISS